MNASLMLMSVAFVNCWHRTAGVMGVSSFLATSDSRKDGFHFVIYLH